MARNDHMRATWIDRALLIGILWFALVLRLSQLDAVPLDYDQSYPHGVGISLLDSIGDGTFGDVALHGQRQSLGLPNPIGVNYILALLAIIDRSPYFAMAAIAVANTLVVAIAYRVASQSGGRVAGVAAALLAAASPWAVNYARGTRQLSLFELSIAVSAVLLWRGQVYGRRRWTAAGIAATALSVHIYGVSIGLLLQLGAQMVLAGRGAYKARVIVLAAGAASALSLALYAVVLMAATGGVLAVQGPRLAYAGEDYGGVLARLPVNLLALVRALGVVGGAEFDQILITSARFASPTRELYLSARALVVALAICLGIILLARKWRANPSARFILTWFLAPVVAITALTTLSRSTPVNYYYMLLTSPAGYALGGVGLGWLISRSRDAANGRARPMIAAAWVVAGIAGSLVPVASLNALAAQQLDPPDDESILNLPLRTQTAIAQAWRAHCAELSVPFDPFENRVDLQYWAASLVGSKFPVRPASEARIGLAQLWTVRQDGATCAIRPVGAPAPPGASTVSASAGSLFRIYRSDPARDPVAPGAPRASVGWALLRASTPHSLRPGDSAQIDVEWRVESLPGEPHAAWRYDLFAKLVDTNGRAAAQGDVPGSPGSAWRVGDIVRQRLILAIPDTIPAGSYALELSLYDRDLMRTAVFSRSPITGPESISLQFQMTIDR